MGSTEFSQGAGGQNCWSGRAARDSNPNRQIRSPPVIVRPLPCGPLVLLTSQNLVLPVRLVCCTPPVGLSSSVKNSVNDGLSRVEHQLPDAVCGRSTGSTRCCDTRSLELS